jgi:hypothetical protein
MFHFAETRYGFRWGPFEIRRDCSDPKWGVMLTIITPRQEAQIRITPSGLIRIGEPTNRRTKRT